MELPTAPSDAAVQTAPGAPSDTASAPTSALELMKFAQSLREYHHKALWEEQKHFTWLISILLAGTLVVAGAQGLGTKEKFGILTMLAAVGIGTCRIAIWVLRREGRNFQYALKRFVPAHNRLFTDDKIPEVVFPGQCESDRQLLTATRRGDLNVRDSFQLIIILFQVAFLIVGIVSACCLIRVLFSDAPCCL